MLEEIDKSSIRKCKKKLKVFIPTYTTLTHFFFLIAFTPCKAEQPLQGMKLQEKETQKD